MIRNSLSQELQMFEGLSLEQLNEKSSFMERMEAKYLLPLSDLPTLLRTLQHTYKILTIRNNSLFTYDNIYMDTDDYFFYTQHQNQESFRTKLRTRNYVESDLWFVEFKQKEKKAIRKFRYQTDASGHGIITPQTAEFFDGLFQNLYGHSFTSPITPALHNNYQRITLCHNDGIERITIDFNINFSDLRGDQKNTASLTNVAIIESKSGQKKPPSKEFLKETELLRAE